MKSLARLADGAHFEDHGDKLGWIRVIHEHQVKWAMPCFQFGEFKVPSNEFIDTYGDSLGVWVEEIKNDSRLVWTGFIFWKSKAPLDIQNDYPFVRLLFTENWKILLNDKPDSNSLVILHSDGTSLEVNRSSGDEKLQFLDGITNHEILLDSSAIKILSNTQIQLNGFTYGVHTQGNWTFDTFSGAPMIGSLTVRSND